MKRPCSPQARSDRKAARTASASAASSWAVVAATPEAPEEEESTSYIHALEALRAVDVSVVNSVEEFNLTYDAALAASALRQVTGTLAIGSSTTAGANAEGWQDIAERVVSHLDTSLGGQFFTPRFVRADVLAARAWAGRRLEIVHHLMREVLVDCVEAAKSNALEMPADGSWRELRTYASFQEYMAPPATITPRTKLFHLFRPLPQDVCQELLEVVPGVGAAAGAGAKELRRTELLSCRRLRVPALELTDTTHSVHVLAEEMSKLGYKVSYGFLNDETRYPTEAMSSALGHNIQCFTMPQAIRVSWAQAMPNP